MSFDRRWFLALASFFVAAVLLSPQRRLELRMLFGFRPEIWNWCPQDVLRVQAADGAWNETNPADLRLLCAARIDGPAPSSEMAFAAVMKAENASGQTAFVERAGDVFRVDGRVFHSYQFESILRKRTKSP